MQTSQDQCYEEKRFLSVLEEATRHKISQGKTYEAMEYIIQNLKLRVNLYGDTSQEAIEYFKDVVQQTCQQANHLLLEGEPAKAIKLLKAIEKLCSTKHRLVKDPLVQTRTEVYHNIGFIYRKMGQSQKAVDQISKSLKLDQPMIERAQTHLNLCGLLTSIGRHKDALKNAIDAMTCSQDAVEQLKQVDTIVQETVIQRYLSVSAIAYHNVAVEYERIGKIQIALEYYQKACVIADNFAPTHALVDTLKTNFTLAKQKVQMMQTGKHFKKRKQVFSAREKGRGRHSGEILNYQSSTDKELLFSENDMQYEKNFQKQHQFGAYLRGEKQILQKKMFSSQQE